MRTKRLIPVAAAALGLAGFAAPALAHDEPVVGSLAGAGIGAIAAGPVGAAIGALIGAGIGSHVAHESDHGDGRHRHARYHRHTHVAPARYSGNGIPVVVQCDPERGYYRPTVTYIEEARPVVVRKVRYEDERPVPAKRVVTRTKMKKVCRYEPVRGSKVVVASR